MKKLQLKKEVVAKLTKNEMSTIQGGMELTTSPWCGAIAVQYSPQTTWGGPIPYPMSFPNDPKNTSCVSGPFCGSVPTVNGCR